ncbi:unnamed protein product, partial [Brachionus calyciflorus]
FDNHFVLPNLGPIGSNGLANARDFQTPIAWFEKLETNFKIILKFHGNLYESEQDHSCFNVVAWHGNYVPYKYNLKNFMAINTVSFDHADPSIFTVLTCPSMKPGTAIADFVIFPPRWNVAEHTFRPPCYHRNCMSEFVGNILDTSNEKQKVQAGGCSLHNLMAPHGPNKGVFESGVDDELKPSRIPDGNISFMFESSLGLSLTDWAWNSEKKENDYHKSWLLLEDNYSKIKN